MLRSLGTRMLDLFRSRHSCLDGPMAGEILTLTENSNASAYLVIKGEIGRYVADSRGRLTWERVA